MSTTSSASSLSAGVQQLYNDGILPSSLSASTLNGASAAQLNKIADSTLESQQVGTLLGLGTSSGDTASLSPTATAATSTDPLTAAVNNALTSNLNTAVNKFLNDNQPTTGTNVNVVG